MCLMRYKTFLDCQMRYIANEMTFDPPPNVVTNNESSVHHRNKFGFIEGVFRDNKRM